MERFQQWFAEHQADLRRSILTVSLICLSFIWLIESILPQLANIWEEPAITVIQHIPGWITAGQHPPKLPVLFLQIPKVAPVHQDLHSITTKCCIRKKIRQQGKGGSGATISRAVRRVTIRTQSECCKPGTEHSSGPDRFLRLHLLRLVDISTIQTPSRFRSRMGCGSKQDW